MEIRKITLQEYKDFLTAYNKPLDYKDEPEYVKNRHYTIYGGFRDQNCVVIAVIGNENTTQNILATKIQLQTEFVLSMYQKLKYDWTIVNSVYNDWIDISKLHTTEDVTVTIKPYKETTKRELEYLETLYRITHNSNTSFNKIKSIATAIPNNTTTALAWFEGIPIAGGMFAETKTEVVELFLGFDEIYIDKRGKDAIELAVIDLTTKKLRHDTITSKSIQVLKPRLTRYLLGKITIK